VKTAPPAAVALALLLVVTALTVAGCGQMGPLVLPDDTAAADADNDEGSDDER